MTTKKLNTLKTGRAKTRQSLKRKPIHLVGGVFTSGDILKKFHKALKSNSDNVIQGSKYIFLDGLQIYEIYIPQGAANPTTRNLGTIYSSDSNINEKLSDNLKYNQYTIYNLGNKQYIICVFTDKNLFQSGNGCSGIFSKEQKKYYQLPSPTYNYKKADDLLNVEPKSSNEGEKEPIYLTPLKLNPSHSSPPPVNRRLKPSYSRPPPAVNRSTKPSYSPSPPAVNRSTKPSHSPSPPAVNRSTKPSYSPPPPAVNRSTKPSTVKRKVTPPKPYRTANYPLIEIKNMGNNKYIAHEYESQSSGITNTKMFDYKPLTTQLKTCNKSIPFAIYTTIYGDFLCKKGEIYEYDPIFKGYKLLNTKFDDLNFK